MQTGQQPTELQKKFDMFFNLYKVLGTLLNEMPLHPEMIKGIRRDFDTGFLWLKEAIIAQEQAQQQAAQLAPQQPSAPMEGEIILDSTKEEAKILDSTKEESKH